MCYLLHITTSKLITRPAETRPAWAQGKGSSGHQDSANVGVELPSISICKVGATAYVSSMYIDIYIYKKHECAMLIQLNSTSRPVGIIDFLCFPKKKLDLGEQGDTNSRNY